MRSRIAFFSVFVAVTILFTRIQAQNCGCTHIIKTPTGGVTFDGNQTSPKVKPGDVLCFEAVERGRIIIRNINGSKEKPVIIKNCGGVATITSVLGQTSNPDPILMQNSSFFRFTGSGDPNFLYGIRINKGQNGMQLSGRCTNFEIDHVEVFNTGFAGIMAKTDPNCADSTTWRENFTMRDISLHHNYVHDVQGEGFYVGNSFYNTAPPSTDVCGKKYPHAIEGVELYRNVVKRTGCEGIQVGSATQNCSIHDNTIDTTGLNPFANFQNNGLQIGNGTGGVCYNNWINYAPGNGISCLGIGDNFFYNNIIINAGADTAKLGIGIFMDEQATPDSVLGTGMKFVNNTIINPRGNAIRIYTDKLPQSYIYNNVVVQYGTSPEYVRKLSSSVNVDQKGNVFRNTMSALSFQDATKNDFRLKSGSPAIGAGVDVSSWEITFDHTNNLRKVPFDAGAFAYSDLITNLLGEVKFLNNQSSFFVYPNPVLETTEELTMRFFLEQSGYISVQSFDMQGKLQGIEAPVFFNAGWNDWKTSRPSQLHPNGSFVFSILSDGRVIDSQIVVLK